MSFQRAPKLAPAVPVPAPSDPVNTDTDRKRRLSSGGVRSTFLGGAGAQALAGPSAVLTGVGGGR